MYSFREKGGLLRSSSYGKKAKRNFHKLLNDEQFSIIHCSGFVGGIAQIVDAKRNDMEPSIVKIHTKHTSPSKLLKYLKSNSEIIRVGKIVIWIYLDIIYYRINFNLK
ncbi:hypothetical protein XM71_u0037 [Vibrio parahaemolyticus]|nr:hypothetical protein XM71_u0037 [Vibrio parahaemolyticus]